jgi:hypothetical protein
MPSDTILYPRRMLYVEAVLYLVIAATSFGLGYLIGRGGQPRSTGGEKEDAAIASRVPIEGTVFYAPPLVKGTPDFGAMVIVLPASKTPPRPLPLLELLLGSESGAAKNPTLEELKGLGGGFARADGEGRFTLFVPQPGSYRVLIISHRATRSSSDTLPPRELEEIGKYFESATVPLQRNQYRWLTWDVKPGAPPHAVEFKE